MARTVPAVVSRRHARTGGQQTMSGRLYGYARVSVASDADANNSETQRPALADCEQVFEGVGSGPVRNSGFDWLYRCMIHSPPSSSGPRC